MTETVRDLRVAFFGSSDFGLPALEWLARATTVVAVVTTREKPKGRGRIPQPSPVAVRGRELNLPVLEPENPNRPEFVAELQARQPALVVLAAYRFLLKPDLLAVPPQGALNIHPSLLPAYRGAAPVQRALMAGETETGVSLFLMNEQLDLGDVIAQRRVKIGENENAGELTARLARTGAELLAEVLPAVVRGDTRRIPQDPDAGSYAPKLTKEERVIDWHLPAGRLHDLIRGLAPVPAAATTFRGQHLEILSAGRCDDRAGRPGELTVEGGELFCGTGRGSLRLLRVKPEGGRAMSGRDFVNGRRVRPGERLGV